MPVLIEANSIVIKMDSLITKFTGGLDNFENIALPNTQYCCDDELFRIGFMHLDDLRHYMLLLEENGLTFSENNACVDFCLVNQKTVGFVFFNPDWAKLYHVPIDDAGHKVWVAKMVGSDNYTVYYPENWVYENSLYDTGRYIPEEVFDETLEYIGLSLKGVKMNRDRKTNEIRYVAHMNEVSPIQ